MCNNNCIMCKISSEERTYPRKCFITGEYCSMQMNIHRERKRLHDKNKIKAFVVMNFSDMSDAVYKWKIKPFVKSIKDYLYFEKDKKKLYCCSDPTQKKKMVKELPDRYSDVEIEVVRSDTEPGSNYVICNRICQQIQIADLVIIDVSTQNPNVFYEFGLAVSLGKLILPICYGESFYKREIPENEELYKLRCSKDNNEKFIGHYPWRKTLFEHFGIMYKKKPHNCTNENKKTNNNTRYVGYGISTDEDLEFDDIKYSRFPYHEKIGIDGKFNENVNIIGQQIYERLERTYNDASYEDNTLVVYTLEAIQNKDEVGRCIVNYHEKITKHLREDECFCGDRVGILVHRSLIPDRDKDAKKPLHLLYNLAEIIHIGMNEALYSAQSDKVKPLDYLKKKGDKEDAGKAEYYVERMKHIEQNVKEYVGNRGFVIYPENPIYVERLKNGLQRDILDMINNKKELFCFFNVMAKSLCYVHEIVVDISKNCVQSLFWLGAAHGLDVNAVTVMHNETPQEREIVTGSAERKERSIFDVSGLWSAIFRSNDTDGFYKQLTQVQHSIEQRDKLIRKKDDEDAETNESSSHSQNDKPESTSVEQLNPLDEQRLESYYRNRFWKRLLNYNELFLYLNHHNESGQTQNDVSISVSKWDMDAVKTLSRYLSRRSVIGEYQMLSINDGENDADAREKCFISVGRKVKPLQKEYIPDILQENKYTEVSLGCPKGSLAKGFKTKGDKCFISWFPTHPCAICRGEDKISESDDYYYVDENEIINNYSDKCYYSETHTEIAQLRIWWEDVLEEMCENADSQEKLNKKRYFRVELNGSSGPATYGLTTLFVDESLRKKENSNSNLLYSMQNHIRNQFVEAYLKLLKKKLYTCCNISEKDEEKISTENNQYIPDDEKKHIEYIEQSVAYCKLVMYSVEMYLSTVLYRYFLPLLTEQDIMRICNGTRTYIITMSADRVSPFVIDNYPADGDGYFSSPIEAYIVEKVMDAIPEILEKMLRGFIGIEAIYQVKVDVDPITEDSKDQDSRIFQNICEMNECDIKEAIHCIFDDKIIQDD